MYPLPELVPEGRLQRFRQPPAPIATSRNRVSLYNHSLGYNVQVQKLIAELNDSMAHETVSEAGKWKKKLTSQSLELFKAYHEGLLMREGCSWRFHKLLSLLMRESCSWRVVPTTTTKVTHATKHPEGHLISLRRLNKTMFLLMILHCVAV